MHTTSAPKREKTDDRRLAIAQAARALIIAKGFEGLRTRDIAEQVGINIATLHYHVPTKDALIALVAESIRADFQQQSLRRPRTGLPALEQWRMELDDFREIVAEMPDLIALMVELSQRARRDPAVETVIRPLYDYWRNQFERILVQGIAEGTFRANIDPGAAAGIITGALSDFWRRDTKDPDILNRIAQEMSRAFLQSAPPKD